ncbi:MAG: hypothetical protein DME26_16280 [Verrucomicrobia bacterium]|nr:MAG: hypothetical protein DME26_16280 [Verrucomicrobiota bacterium]
MVDVRQSRNTSLIEIRVLSKDQVAAAQIANAIADVYRRQTSAAKNSAAVELVDAAEPGIRPVRPNVPLSLSLGWIGSVVVATLVALLLRGWLPKNARSGSTP